MKKTLIPFIAFIAVCINISAQEKSKRELKGDKHFFVYSFDKAIDKYSHTKKLTAEGQRRLAESYHNIDQNIKSEEVYSNLLNAPGEILPEDYYNYAMVLKTNGNYDSANKWMGKFKELKPEDVRGKDDASNNTELLHLLKDDGKYKTEHMEINSDMEDFGACFYNNKIVFSSSRANPKMIVRKYNWTGNPFWNMYISEVEDGQLKNPKIFDKSLNGNMHDGPASFCKNGTLMAFTRNNYEDKTEDRIVELQIFFSGYNDGKWSKPEPFILNNKEYSVGHPSLSSDGNIMYFTSDMPGGYGKADIYRVTKDEKTGWGKPENLGNKINTEGDEMFPFFEDNNEILFFASNGRYGLGGLDIFIADFTGSEPGKIYNAGFPLNTQYDDYALIVDNTLNKGYFSSDRTGGSGNDDIYSVDLLKNLDLRKKIKGIAKENNGNLIPGTFISLLDVNGNILDTFTTNSDAAFAFSVDSDKEFTLIGAKENYLDGKTMVSTFSKAIVVKADVILSEKEEAVVNVVKKEEIVLPKPEIGADLGKIIELNSIYFDYKKFNIRPDAEIELEKIAKIMNDNPFMVVELSSHTDCRATKGFNQILSDKRANASANYIKSRITKPERIYGKGYGETKAVNGCACEGTVVSDCSEDEFQKDRRTEFIILDNYPGQVSKVVTQQ